MSCHLATRNGWLCHIAARWPACSAVLGDVTCKWCFRRLVEVEQETRDAILQARHDARVAEAIEATGLAEPWAFLTSRGDEPSSRMAREMFASFATYLHESGYNAAARLPRAG